MTNFEFKITEMLGMHLSIQKFDNEAIKRLVFANEFAAAAITGDIGIVFICRDNLKNYKNEDWVSEGVTYHTIIVPYDKVMSIDKEEVTKLCAELVVERLLQWAEKKAKTRIKAA
jgi:hypothetical protein